MNCAVSRPPSPGELKTIRLHTGEHVPEPAMQTTMMILEELASKDPVALYEAHQLAQNPNHNVEAHLQQLLDSIQGKRADRIAEHEEPWSVLAAIVRDGDY